MGGGSTSSPFVGLVLIKPKPVPDLPSPPINSLPPLRCPPGREGIAFEPDESGESGGLAIPESIGKDAAGLKLKLGNGGGGERPKPVNPLCNSKADICLRPEALE